MSAKMHKVWEADLLLFSGSQNASGKCAGLNQYS